MGLRTLAIRLLNSIFKRYGYELFSSHSLYDWQRYPQTEPSYKESALPDDAENYVHRIGRTGRAGRTGHAISLATPEQRNDVQNIERIIRMTLPISQHAEVQSVTFHKPQVLFSSHRGSRGRRSGFRKRRR